MNAIHTRLARTGFVRTDDGRVFGGVCSGIAQRYGFQAWAVRALFIGSLLLIPGSQILLYPIAWLLMPSQAQARQALTAATVNPTSPSAPTTVQDVQDTVVR